MRRISGNAITVRGIEYLVAPNIIAEVEAILAKAKRKALARECDAGWVPIEKIFPDIDHPIKGAANYLRSARSREQMTQTQLAAKTGIKQSHISEMERYKRPIGKDVAKRLASALNCNWRNMISG